MMYDFDGTFTPDANGDYTSISRPGSPSPAYLVAYAARRLIEEGHVVALPQGYTVDTLSTITWTLGHYDELRRVTARQAKELREIARTLRESHNPQLLPGERTAAVRMTNA